MAGFSRSKDWEKSWASSGCWNRIPPGEGEEEQSNSTGCNFHLHGHIRIPLLSWEFDSEEETETEQTKDIVIVEAECWLGPVFGNGGSGSLDEVHSWESTDGRRATWAGTA